MCFFKTTIYQKIISPIICVCFVATNLIIPQHAQANTVMNLPIPGALIMQSTAFKPVNLHGIQIKPKNPLVFDFLIDAGDSGLKGADFSKESEKLIKYFLTALTTPEEELWVNLSPYEKDRIVAKGLNKTEMGRDLLVQDYILKQLTASLMHPEEKLGGAFWKRVYSKVEAKFGTIDIPVDTFNKIWIVPHKARIYEHEKGAFILESNLKVMLEQDYLALQKNLDNQAHGALGANQEDQVRAMSADVIREILIPEIEREVNEGAHFANLRQIYNALLLAVWYKQNLKESILGNVLIDQNKTKGIEIQDPDINQKIYTQYLEAFKQGVYDIMKEEYDPTTQQIINQKYFSGGMDYAQTTQNLETVFNDALNPTDLAMVNHLKSIMTTTVEIQFQGNTGAIEGKSSTPAEQEPDVTPQAETKSESDAAMNTFGIPEEDMIAAVDIFLDGSDTQNSPEEQEDSSLENVLAFLREHAQLKFAATLTSSDQQHEFARTLINIPQEHASGTKRKNAATELLGDFGFKKDRRLAAQLVKEVISITENPNGQDQQNAAQRMDIIGIFQTHLYYKDSQAIRPTLDHIVKIAKRQNRPVVYIQEDAGGNISMIFDIIMHFTIQQSNQLFADIYNVNTNSPLLQKLYKHYYPSLTEEIKTSKARKANNPPQRYADGMTRFANQHNRVTTVKERPSLRAWILDIKDELLTAFIRDEYSNSEYSNLFTNVFYPGVFDPNELKEKALRDQIQNFRAYLLERDSKSNFETHLEDIRSTFDNPIVIVTLGTFHHPKLDPLSLDRYRFLRFVENVPGSNQNIGPEYLPINEWLALRHYYAPNVPLSETDLEMFRRMDEFNQHRRSILEQKSVESAKEWFEKYAQVSRKFWDDEFLEKVRAGVKPEAVEPITIRDEAAALLEFETTTMNTLEEKRAHIKQLLLEGKNELAASIAKGFGISLESLQDPDNSSEENAPKEENEASDKASEPVIDSEEGHAAMTTPGGIDLNPEILSMDVKVEGKGFQMQVPQDLSIFDPANIEGAIPVIINIAPVTNLPLLLGLDLSDDQNEEKDDAPTETAQYHAREIETLSALKE